MSGIDFALNPELGDTRSRERPLSNREQMQRARALCALSPQPNELSCSGNLFVGMFFDGTGNNEDIDYKACINDPSKQKHSNVVRLYHTYLSDNVGTNAYSRYYIPGVGTPFPQIGDAGGGLGSATSWGGEPRIVWGLIQIFNAVHKYHTKSDLIPDGQAKTITEGLGGLGSVGAQRRYALKQVWQEKLKAAIKDRKPEIQQISISVFGFSRGAAEARTFVNWLYEICEQKDGGWRFAGIPLRVQFLGLFDTVASVGAAGLYTIVEGHQSWADGTMQIHPHVEQCLHFVAAHEVRGCFPSDSVRVEGKYPPNAKEYLYPGMHSDVGGGYDNASQGKSTGLARIPGFEMYCAALAAGVPLTQYHLLKKQVADALTPDQAAIDAFKSYSSQAAIAPGPLEDMVRQHMSWYFSYRWQARDGSYAQRSFFGRAKKSAPAEVKYLLRTQRAFMHVVMKLGEEIDQRIKSPSMWSNDDALETPYAKSQSSIMSIMPLISAADSAIEFNSRRTASNEDTQNGVDAKAANIITDVVRWRKWLSDHNQAEVHDASAPERDPLSLVDVLKPEKIPNAMGDFFDTYVHDSMAGFAANSSVDEFLWNGIGMAKFRRIYFGDRGDAMIKEAVEKANKERVAKASHDRRQRAQWDQESREFSRTQMQLR